MTSTHVIVVYRGKTIKKNYRCLNSSDCSIYYDHLVHLQIPNQQKYVYEGQIWPANTDFSLSLALFEIQFHVVDKK